MVDDGERTAGLSTEPLLRGRLNVPVLLPSAGRVDFARYELRELLGEGGYGAVYAAWDSRLQRSVALKRLNLQVSAGGDSEAWVQEARLAARVNHRAFVTVYDVFVDQGAGHIVMERIEGRSLNRVLAAGPVPIEQALQWALQASEALAEAHQQHIAHGDIKPANLMVDDSGQLRILDFGVARLIDRMATLGPGTAGTAGAGGQTLVSGTLAYMAPEQMLGRPANVASDIYALGLVLGEMLSGQRAFMEPNPLALAHHKLHGSELILALPELPAGLAPLAALVQRMVNRHPALRPASMGEVAEALRALLAQRPDPGLLPLATSTALSPLGARRPLRALQHWLRVDTAPLPAGPGHRRAWLASGLLLAALGWGAWRWGLPWQSQPPWPARLAQAEQLYLSLDEEGEALGRIAALLEGVAAEQPKNARAQALLALVYATQYQQDAQDEAWLQRADASAQLALHHEDQLALAHVAQAQVFKLQGRAPDAAKAFERALQLDGRALLGLHGYAMLELTQGRRAEARQLLDRGLSLYPDDPLLLHGLGQLAFEQNELPAAEAAFRRVVAIKPYAAAGYANLSAVLVKADRLDEALSVLQQGLSLRSSSQLYTNLGNVLFGRGRYVEAAQAFERALSDAKGRPHDYRMWANLADTLRVLPGRAQDAERSYGRAVALLQPLLVRNPKDATLLSRAALYTARSGERERAAALIQNALALAPQAPDVLFRAALVAELLGQREQALGQLKAARARGYPAHFMEQDADLTALRRDPRYPPWSSKEKQP